MGYVYVLQFWCLLPQATFSRSLSRRTLCNNCLLYTSLLLNKFDEKFDKFDIQFNELKNEIKLGHNNLIKKCDKLITKLDENLNLIESQLERQKVLNSSNQQNAVLNINLLKNNNSDNECNIDNSNNISSKIIIIEV